ncbi:MAG: hypothetical protein ACYTXC_26630 [Nostoc sp.]
MTIVSKLSPAGSGENFGLGQIKTYIQGQGCFLEMKLAKKGQKAAKRYV